MPINDDMELCSADPQSMPVQMKPSNYEWSNDRRMYVGLTKSKDNNEEDEKQEDKKVEEIWASWSIAKYSGTGGVDDYEFKSTLYNSPDKGKGSHAVKAKLLDLTSLPAYVPDAHRTKTKWKPFLLKVYKIKFGKSLKKELEKKREIGEKQDSTAVRQTNASSAKAPSAAELEELFFDFEKEITTEQCKQIAVIVAKAKGHKQPIPWDMIHHLREYGMITGWSVWLAPDWVRHLIKTGQVPEEPVDGEAAVQDEDKVVAEEGPEKPRKRSRPACLPSVTPEEYEMLRGFQKVCAKMKGGGVAGDRQ